MNCILWYGNLYLEQWSLLDDLHFHTWTVMNCYRLWSLIIGVFIHMIRFIAMRDWGSCLNSMIIDMKGRTLNMISFFIAMIEKRKCNELLIIAMKSQISSMKTDTFISSSKLLWPLWGRHLSFRNIVSQMHLSQKTSMMIMFDCGRPVTAVDDAFALCGLVRLHDVMILKIEIMMTMMPFCIEVSCCSLSWYLKFFLTKCSSRCTQTNLCGFTYV